MDEGIRNTSCSDSAPAMTMASGRQPKARPSRMSFTSGRSTGMSAAKRPSSVTSASSSSDVKAPASYSTLIARTTRSGGGGVSDCASSCLALPKLARSSFTRSTVFSSGTRAISASSNAGITVS